MRSMQEKRQSTYREAARSSTLKEGCTKVAHYAALNNAGITGIYIPDSVGQIGGGAFGGCSSLPVWNLQKCTDHRSGLESVLDCTVLTEISIPDSLTRIGTGTFSGCTSLLSKIAISENSRLSQVEYAAFGYYPYPYRYIDLSDMVLRNPPVLSGKYRKRGYGVPITDLSAGICPKTI